MSCYVCLEECSEKSPCQCEHIVHKKCLNQTCEFQSIVHCTICKSSLIGYTLRENPRHSEYNHIEFDESDADSDDSYELMTSVGIAVSTIKYYIFYFLWWILLSTIVSIIWCFIFCKWSQCPTYGYSIILCLAFLLEFTIIFCSFKNCDTVRLH